MARHVQSTQNRNLVIFLEYLQKKMSQVLLYSIVRQNTQIFLEGPVTLVVACFILGIKIVTKIKKTTKQTILIIFSQFHGSGNWFGKCKKLLKVLANVFFKVCFLRCKIWDSSIPSQVLKIYWKVQNVAENDSFQSFSFIFKPLKLVWAMKNNCQIFNSCSNLCIFSTRKKFTK